MLYVFVILYLSFTVSVLWASIVLIWYFCGFCIMFGGGFGWCGVCWACGRGGMSGVLGVKFWLFEKYCGLSVRAGGCCVHGFGQFVVQLG